MPETYRPGELNRSEIAHIGKSVVIKGELSGSEDLYVDGEVEGSIELPDHNITIGPNGQVRANINAKEVVIQGKVDGAVTASAKVELRKSGVLVGDIVTQRIVIEDGAYFKGGVDVRKEPAGRPQAGATGQPVTSAAAAAPSSTLPTQPASATRP